MKKEIKILPSPSEATRWLSPDVFVVDGKKYIMDIHGKVSELLTDDIQAEIGYKEYLKNKPEINTEDF